MGKKALITGIAGQDGSYLSELLLAKGYEVHGLVRKSGGKDGLWRINHILDKLTIHSGDATDYGTVRKLVVEVRPDEIYHLAAKHDLPNSLENYLAIKATNLDSTYFFLSAIKELSPNSKFFFASSSRVFGDAKTSPQSEETPMSPNSLYGISKAAASAVVRMYREKEGIFACSGILFNHESPRRDAKFLTRKVSKAVAGINKGSTQELKLGNLDAVRDWGFAGDFVEAMWLMLQQETPEDYVIGTGEVHSVKDFLDVAFGLVNLDWRKYVKVDETLLRPTESELRADISKAKGKLRWTPRIKFEELVQMMVAADIRAVN